MTAATGVEFIADERLRQITAEGWTPAHDDEHTAGQLLDAAEAYLTHRVGPCPYCKDTLVCDDENWSPGWPGHRRLIGDGRLMCQQLHGEAPGIWPWDHEFWKPSEDQIRNLVKAGALIAAEIDRLIRANQPATR